MPGCPVGIYLMSKVIALLRCLIYTVFGIVLPTFIGGHASCPNIFQMRDSLFSAVSS